MPKCSTCSQLVMFRSGARTYYKCDWLDKLVYPEKLEEQLKECPLKGAKK